MNLKKTSIAILCAIGLANIFFTSRLKDIKYDFNIASFYPAGDQNTLFFDEYTKKFGSDSDYILIGIRNSEGIFQKDFLIQVDSLREQLEALPNVEWVLSPTNVRNYQQHPLAGRLMELPYLHFNDPERYEVDSARIYASPHLVPFLFSEDTRSVLLFVRNQDFLEEIPCRELNEKIRSTVQGFSFKEWHIGGKCNTQTTFINIIQSETNTFTTANIFFLLLCLFIAYRTFWGVWMPILVVGLSVTWTLAIMIMFGKDVDFVSNILPTIILIIGIANAIHLLTHYLSRIRAGEDKIPALKKSVQEVGVATLMTTFTTAIGFLTLTTSSFSALADLGIYAAVGLFLAFTFTYLLIPSIIVLHKPLQTRTGKWPSLLEEKLKSLFHWVKGHQNAILLVSGLVMLLGIFGATQIRLNTHILQDLRDRHFMKKDFTFLGNEFGGARSFELALTVKDSNLSIFSSEVLLELNQVDSFLIHQYGVNNMVSPVVLMKQANLIYHRQKEDFYKLPQKEAQFQSLERNLNKYGDAIHLERFVTEDRRESRISGRIPDWGSHKVGEKNEALNAFIASQFPESKIDYRLTGSIHLMDLNTSYLAKNVLQGLLIAILVIGLLFAYILRSFRIIWLSLLPNILPLLFIAGVMGFTGIDLKLSTSVIFIISFGIAVDDSIHFLSRFWREIKHHPVEKAVYNTYISTGKAILLTSVILVGGFTIICVSDFLATVYIGLLIATTLLIALIADLTLLPVLLLKFYKKKDTKA